MSNIYTGNTKEEIMRDFDEEVKKFNKISSTDPSYGYYLNKLSKASRSIKILNSKYQIKSEIEQCMDHDQRVKLMEEYIFLNGNKVAVFGLMWGDEGKGKVVSMFSDVDYVVAATGGGNAGHAIKFGKKILIFHELPGGAVIRKAKVYLSKGRVINITDLEKEIKMLDDNGINTKDKIIVGGGAQIIFKGLQREIDSYIEKIKDKGAVGTTKKGIGPAYAIKALRTGITFNMLLEKDTKVNDKVIDDFLNQNAQVFKGASINKDELKQEIKLEKEKLLYLINNGKVSIDPDDLLINKEVKNGKKAVCELSQSSSLSLDGGGYPYCTSSDTSINGVRSAVNLSEIDTTIGVLKFILTKVGGGRLVTKFEDHRIEEVYRKKESEIGGTTERDRDIGWLNLVELRKSLSTNAVDIMFMTKMDALNTLKDVLKKATKQENPMLKICDYYKKDLIVGKGSSDQDIEKIYSGILNSNEQLSGISPEYIERAFPTINLSGVKNTRNLDANTKDIIDTIVSKLNFTGEVMLGTGRGKDDVMFY